MFLATGILPDAKMLEKHSDGFEPITCSGMPV